MVVSTLDILDSHPVPSFLYLSEQESGWSAHAGGALASRRGQDAGGFRLLGWGLPIFLGILMTTRNAWTCPFTEVDGLQMQRSLSCPQFKHRLHRDKRMT